MSADHTNEMTVLNNSQKPGKRETLLPVSSVFQFQGTGKLLGQLGPAEHPCVAWGAWFSLSFCTHCKGMKHCQKTCVETRTPLHTENSFEEVNKVQQSNSRCVGVGTRKCCQSAEKSVQCCSSNAMKMIPIAATVVARNHGRNMQN